ncbi:rhodanese-like domain-containing protein, partial [Francisella tularensis]|uniref:rhodanese-like domain-containing protein n=1 Tax=Francisella tularensis TaxID=263 RepID=UPI0023AE15A6|nr:pyridine nucleotide-disulfide oxidoreductase [Francisella tularensis subsp. holarctica]
FCETRLCMLTYANNIPLSVIITRLSEIDINQPVYVHCQTGQISYNVVLMLKQHVYDAYNNAGGYIIISHYYDTIEYMTG